MKKVRAESPGEAVNPSVEPLPKHLDGRLYPGGSVELQVAESPRPDNREGENVQPEADGRHVCVLVVGPSGSGKSTFVASVSGASTSDSKAMIGHGLDPGTTSCSSHDFIEPLSGTRITLLDTPGFNDQSRNDIDILAQIAETLSSQTLPPISAVIFTHAITENRVTGSTRLNLDIAKALCGETFYHRAALLTTMWNKAPSDEARELFSTREAQILSSPTLWAEMKKRGCRHARFDGSCASGMILVKEVLDLGKVDTAGLAFQQELLRGAKLEQTKAGAIIVAEREKRQRQMEEELEEIKKEHMESLHAEREQLRAFGQRRPELVPTVVTRAPSTESAMAYGESFNPVGMGPGAGSVREAQQPRRYWRNWKLQVW